MNIPGFTAEASLYKTSGHYRIAGTPNSLAALTLALIGSISVVPDVDCTDFPDNQTCRECGPWGTLDCCELRRPPDDICIIKERSMKVPPTSRFPRFPAVLKGLGSSVVQVL